MPILVLILCPKIKQIFYSIHVYNKQFNAALTKFLKKLNMESESELKIEPVLNLKYII